ncbi:hypothetical protein TI39_contig380g00006 [Zymoseptoria brevis]|uniref:F-box domain-containing protein n=1 Tax=Zymoseptoria brevis TaxID=1047168 RepID=A0A0F4GNI7_9PEZI|nr:hypothetical protein TI39_contig380g00006 [Zymoseptoria brevis]
MENSSFQKLPQELRRIIYRYALTKPYPIELLAGSTTTRHSRLPRLLPAPISCMRHANILALTTVCRQLHEETVPVFLQENIFRIITQLDVPSWGLTLRAFNLQAAHALLLCNAKLGLWLLGLDENLLHLHSFEVELWSSPVLRLERMVSTYRMCGLIFSIVQRQSGVDLTLKLRVPCSDPLDMGGWFEMQFMGSDTTVARIGLEESEARLKLQLEENRAGLTPAQMEWTRTARNADLSNMPLERTPVTPEATQYFNAEWDEITARERDELGTSQITNTKRRRTSVTYVEESQPPSSPGPTDPPKVVEYY